MKRIITLLTALVLTATVMAQTPNSMSYQAVIRDANNALVSSQAVGVQISILQGSATGTAVYVETQTPTSNANGLISLEIGEGTLVSGDFSTIDWGDGPFFIQTETDPTGGTNYTITGTSQLLSVPYALHAKVADSLVGGVNITETDPVFGASIAHGITAADTANWNNPTANQLDESAVDAFVENNGYALALEGVSDTVFVGNWSGGIGNGDSALIATMPTHTTWHFDVVFTAQDVNSNTNRRNMHKEFIAYRQWDTPVAFEDLVVHYDATTGHTISIAFETNANHEIRYKIVQTGGISTSIHYNLKIRMTQAR